MTSSTLDLHSAAREMRRWAEPLGRFGFAAKGAIYVLIGTLAAQAAAGMGGDATGSEGALRRIVQLPFGRVLLAAVALGLLGYALWRFIQAYKDTENKGSQGKGLAIRAGYVVIGLIHLGLAWSAVLLVRGGSASNAGNSKQHWTAWLLAQPYGQWLVGAVGAIVVVVGLYQFYQAYSAQFRERLKTGEMSGSEETWALRLGRAGFAARGVVFCLAGALVILGAIHADPTNARGLEGALEVLERQSYAPWLFGLVAVGLVAYGLFQWVLARYRRMVIR